MDKGSPPLRLPPGLELPSGRFLTYPPTRECECADCVEAYRAHRQGELILPGGELPWAV